MKGGIGFFIVAVILMGVFGTAVIFGYMIFSNAESEMDIGNFTNETNATYTATSDVIMFGMSFMEVLALLFIIAALFAAALLLIKIS